MLKPEFWKGKKVFVTGHTGFKGSWLCLWLEHLGSKVTGYVNNPATAGYPDLGAIGVEN